MVFPAFELAPTMVQIEVEAYNNLQQTEWDYGFARTRTLVYLEANASPLTDSDINAIEAVVLARTQATAAAKIQEDPNWGPITGYRTRRLWLLLPSVDQLVSQTAGWNAEVGAFQPVT